MRIGERQTRLVKRGLSSDQERTEIGKHGAKIGRPRLSSDAYLFCFTAHQTNIRRAAFA